LKRIKEMRSMWKTILYIITAIIIGIVTYFSSIDTIYNNRLCKLSEKAAKKAFENNDFSMFNNLTEKSSVTQQEKLLIVIIITLIVLFIIWVIIKTANKVQLEDVKEDKEAKVTRLKKQQKHHGIFMFITWIFSIIYIVYEALKQHQPVVYVIIFPLALLIIIIIIYKIEIYHIELHKDVMSNFESRFIFFILFLGFLLVGCLTYYILKFIGIDILKWHF
jgi:hypothetical protein